MANQARLKSARDVRVAAIFVAVCLALAAYAASAHHAYAVQLKAGDVELEASQGDVQAQAAKKAKASVSYTLRRSSGWSDSAKNGKGAGWKTKSFKYLGIKLSDGCKGTIAYKVHSTKGSWSSWQKDGWEAEAAKGSINGVKIKLKGSITKKYNVAYRVHACGHGWKKWVKNGKKCVNSKAKVDLIQVKLVKKGQRIVKNRNKIVRVAVASLNPGGESPTCNYVRKCGMVPVRVSTVKVNTAKYDGLVIPGGVADVTPRLYGAKQSPRTNHPNIKRDLLFIGLIQRFAKAEKPILGICGGEQHMNVAFGGTLLQHIPGRHSGGRTVSITKNSWLYGLFGASESTYHAHHQCVKKPGTRMMVTQRDVRDGRVEGIEHETLPVYGVQWHPEAMGARGVKVGHLFKRDCIAYRV